MSKRLNGAIAESKVVSALFEDGAVVSEPLHYEARYDLLVDYSGDIYRVQVKKSYSRDSDDIKSVTVDTRCRNESGSTPYTSDKIDAFAVYVDVIEEVLPKGLS